MSYEDTKKFIIDNYITISLIILLIAIVYVNIKVNDLDYRLQQTIIHAYDNDKQKF